MPDYLIKEETLTNIANAIRSETGTTAKINPDDMDTAISNIVTLSEGTADATAVAADLLSGKTAYVNGNKISGSMANQGAKTSTLNCGGSYIIPAGYHNGSGKITANSLASQTDATATAAQILSGKTAWVKGTKLTGTLVQQSSVNGSATCTSRTKISISAVAGKSLIVLTFADATATFATFATSNRQNADNYIVSIIINGTSVTYSTIGGNCYNQNGIARGSIVGRTTTVTAGTSTINISSAGVITNNTGAYFCGTYNYFAI